MKKIATVGTFDGMHLGHKTLLHTLRHEAQQRGLTPCVFTFSKHPLEVIAPERAPAMIIPASRKLSELQGEGVELSIPDFTPQMAALSAREWLCNLRDNHDAAAIVIGYDNTFGCDGRSLCFEDYIKLANELGLECIRAPELPGISSSAVRKAIAVGDMEKAAEMLGHPFTLHGIVVKGNQIGRTIGVPTANLQLEDPQHQLLPPPGAYAATAIINYTPERNTVGNAEFDKENYMGQTLEYQAVANIGFRPTLNPALQEKEPRIEAHLLNFSGDLYGLPIELELTHFLRPEKKFSSLEALKTQINSDIKAAESTKK